MGLTDDLAALQTYATEHGLEFHAEAPQVGTSQVTMSGSLGQGLSGSVRVVATAAGNLVRVTFLMPETIAYVPTLLCHPPGFGLDVLTDQLTGDWVGGRRLRTEQLESVALDRRFDVEVNPRQDPVWLRTLFPPTFVDWLAREAPQQLVFALDSGVLHVGLDDPALGPAELDRLVDTATTVAARIHEQCALEHAAGQSRALVSAGTTEAAQAPHLVPQGAAARASLGCSSLASAGFVFVLTVVAGTLVLESSAGGYGRSALWSLVLGAALAVLMVGRVVRGARTAAVAELQLRPRDQPVVTAYAAAHFLAHEDPALFHARRNGLALPGLAAYVLDGPLPAVGRDGSLALCVDRSDPLHPVDWNVCVLDLAEGDAPLVSRPGLGVATLGRTIALFERSVGPATAAGLDAFLVSCAQTLGAAA